MAPKQISRKSSLASYDFRKSQEAMAPLVHFSSGEEEKRGGGWLLEPSFVPSTQRMSIGGSLHISRMWFIFSPSEFIFKQATIRLELFFTFKNLYYFNSHFDSYWVLSNQSFMRNTD